MTVFFITYFYGILAFSSSRKHVLITLLRMDFVVLVLYFPICFYLRKFNYSLFFVAYFLGFFLFVKIHCLYLFWWNIYPSHFTNCDVRNESKKTPRYLICLTTLLSTFYVVSKQQFKKLGSTSFFGVSRYRSEGTGNGYGWRVRVSNPCGGQIFRTRSDRIWGTPSLL